MYNCGYHYIAHVEYLGGSNCLSFPKKINLSIELRPFFGSKDIIIDLSTFFML